MTGIIHSELLLTYYSLQIVKYRVYCNGFLVHFEWVMACKEGKA